MDKRCVEWFVGHETYWGCYLVPIPRGTKPTTRYCRICCRDVKMSSSNFVSHIEKCHPMFYNVKCLNINILHKMKPIEKLNTVLSSYNCVLFNLPCNCVDCNAINKV